MSAKLQVYLASFITVCAVVLLVFTGVRGVQVTRTATSDLSEHAVPQLRYLERMRFGVIRVVSSTAELMVATMTSDESDVTAEIKNVELALIQRGKDEFLSAYDAVSRLHTPTSPSLGAVMDRFDRLLEGLERIIDLTKQDATSADFADAKEDFESLETAVLAAIDIALAQAQRLVDADFEELVTATNTLSDGILGLGLTCLLTLLIYSIFVTRLIRHEEAARQDAEKLATAHKREVELRKRIESRLASHQKLEALGTMLGGIAHSVNNFLTPILTLTRLLKKDLPPDTEQQEDLDHILRSANNASTVLKQVLAFSRSGESGSEPIEIVSCLKTALAVASAAVPSTVTLREWIAVEEAWVPAREADIEAIILNLTSNAVDAMEGRTGFISVELDQVTVADGLLDGSPVRLEAGPYARLCVADSGSGVARDALPNIFDPFFTTKAVGKGSGLGLSVTYSIVSQAGGDIVVESSMGAGTRFDILLPLLARPASDAAA